MKATVWSNEAQLLDVVLSAGAAAGVEIGVGVRTTAGPVLIGEDRAGELVHAPWLRGREVYLVGSDAALLAEWSVVLDARVLLLPAGARWLTGILGGQGERAGQVVAVLGGSGGVGTSTVAAGLAYAGAQAGLTTGLVDLDAAGAGIDVLLAAETAGGWRWPDLAAAVGEVGDLRAQLPQVEGISVLAMTREGALPEEENVDSVLRSLARTHAWLVLDLGRWPRPEAIGLADRLLVVSGSRVTQVTAARRAAHLSAAGGVVVVPSRRSGLSAAEIAASIGTPLLGEVPHDTGVIEGGDQGLAPWRCARKPWRRAMNDMCARLRASLAPAAATSGEGRGRGR